MPTLRTRIAPTPSGRLHIGNGVSFIVTWVLARANAGKILLRIDDLDADRSRKKYVNDIFETLEWLGLDYDEGPSGPDDFYANYSQHLRLPLYQEALETLRNSGHLFACTCSRRQIRRQSGDGRYPGTCHGRNLDWWAPKTAWRVRVPDTAIVSFEEWQRGLQKVSLGTEMGDFVIRQKNRQPAYQISSLIDDLYWNINFVVRGEDLLPSTAAQLYLAQLLDQRAFSKATFWHHRLLTNDQGEKLSKSKAAESLKVRREMGHGPEELYRLAAHWLGVGHDVDTTLPDLVAAVARNKT